MPDRTTGAEVQFVLMPYPTPTRYLTEEAAQAYQGFDEKNRNLMRAFTEWLRGVQTSPGFDPALPSVLKTTTVHFLGIWWFPFGRETIIIALEPEYRWLATGHPSLRYGRILAREPTLSDDALKTIAATLALEGFDLCAFVLTPQTGGRERSMKLCEVVR